MKKLVITQPLGLSNAQLNELRELVDVTHYDSISKSAEEWLNRVTDADIIFTNIHGFDAGWKELKGKYITYPFVTSAFLDKELLKANNMLISNSPGCNQVAVTPHP